MSSCQSCEPRVSNNKHPECPSIMADGRHFTDYRPRCDVNWVFPQDKAMNSFDYRQYLTNNADALIQKNRDWASKLNACGPCKEPFEVGTMLPEQTKMVCDAQGCRVMMNDPAGLGMGRQYDTEGVDAMGLLSQGPQKETDVFSKYAECCAPDANPKADAVTAPMNYAGVSGSM